MTIKELQKLRESEDKVEFKEAKENFPWNGGSHTEQKERRKCFLGYVVALANEGGGHLVLGMADKLPHKVVGSNFADGKLGGLEDTVYEKLGIRVHIKELFDEAGLRVVVTSIPSRPIGRTLKFEGVALMRTGDSLQNMTDEEVYKILSEQEPDFSAKVCPELSPSDLDETAITILKEKYARKQNNPAFVKLPLSQVLTDLKLAEDKGITYAALILIGNEQALQKYLPNAQVNVEYRETRSQTHFDKRKPILKPLFIAIDEIWGYLNGRNKDNKISEGPYKFDLPYFNEEVIREATLNAIAHRDYSINSETVIKQFPDSITILNAGGFPKGVTKENLISVSSVPRSRLLTDILEKTGLVERSGQGVDKIFRITLSEGKPEPDYSKTDYFQVELSINGQVADTAFAAFISGEQGKRNNDNQLGTFEIIGLHHIKEGKSDIVDSDILETLEKEGAIKRAGGTASTKYVLADEYFALKNIVGEIGGFRTIDLERISGLLKTTKEVKMSHFVDLFEGDLNRAQVKYLIDRLLGRVLDRKGSGKGTRYLFFDGIDDLESIKAAIDSDVYQFPKKEP